MDADPHRYHVVTRVLHWTMAAAILAQFGLGYAIDRADDLVEWAADRWLDGETGVVFIAHLGLGVTILVLAVIRLAWRRLSDLPPWAPGLTPLERRIVHRVEQVLYLSMFLIPVTGIALVIASGEDWDMVRGEWQAPFEVVDDDVLLGAHIATHLAFLAALALHLGVVAKHQFIHRDRLLRRMW